MAGKMLAGGAPGSTSMSVKATREEQADLIAAAPETYSVAAYTGRFGWVEVDLSTVDPDELRDLVERAWRRTAPKRLVRQFDASATE